MGMGCVAIAVSIAVVAVIVSPRWCGGGVNVHTGHGLVLGFLIWRTTDVT
jgi:hypothetical protein